jgi:hypothetical protein
MILLHIAGRPWREVLLIAREGTALGVYRDLLVCSSFSLSAFVLDFMRALFRHDHMTYPLLRPSNT